MQVVRVHTDMADRKSAEVFFGALLDLYEVEGNALDMFARNGELTVVNYYNQVQGDLDVWELGPEHRDALSKFKPDVLYIGCSYMALRTCEKTYSLVVIDTPQGVHHDQENNFHVEHFSVISNIGKLLDDIALIVLYVNKSPYNKNEVGSYGYDEYKEYDYDRWMAARKNFYHADPEDLTEEKALAAYRDVMETQGFRIRSLMMVPCFSDVPQKAPYAFRLSLQVERIGAYK